MSETSATDVRRVGSAIRLRPEKRAEYLELHSAVWPEVEAQITRSNIRNFTIFLREDMLFSYLEYVGEDYAGDMAAIKADPHTQRWWALTDPCQEQLPGTPEGENWAPMDAIWHLD